MASNARQLSFAVEDGRVFALVDGQRYEAGSLPALETSIREDHNMADMLFIPADEAARTLVESAQELHRKLEVAQEAVQRQRGPIFFKLWCDFNLSVRDIALVVGGVSHGTVNKLILEEKARVAAAEKSDGQ